MALSLLVASWVVITSTCGAAGDGGCRLDGLLSSLLDSNNIHKRFCRDIQSTKMCTILFFVCLIRLNNFSTVLLSYYFFSHRLLGIVDLAALSSLVAPWVVITATYGANRHAMVVGLTIVWFRCWFTVISTSLKREWYFSIFVLSCLNNFSIVSLEYSFSH